MHIVVNDLGLAHLRVIYPGTERYPLGDHITALPLRDLPGLTLNEKAGT